MLSAQASSWAAENVSSGVGFVEDKEGSSRTSTPESRPAHASLKEAEFGTYDITPRFVHENGGDDDHDRTTKRTGEREYGLKRA